MTRLPREGRNKTRLIPALGSAGAMHFHDQLARHAIGRASSFCMAEKKRHLRVCIEGGTPIECKSWLGDESLDCREQAPGDLGIRMETAAREAFEEGAEKVIIIGTDCPSIDEVALAAAEQALDSNDLVYIPALDGGYVLIGMSKLVPKVFRDIPWGGDEVLEKSLAAASSIGAKVQLLSPLPDVDLPEDLPAAKEALKQGSTVSVIIPTYREETGIVALLKNVAKSSPHEIIVSDGNSPDSTVSLATAAGATVITSAKGRAAQMNAGACAATGEFLLFLHADTIPPADFPEIIARTLRKPNTPGGAFSFRLSGDFSASALIEGLVSLRCKFAQKPYGDQGIFIRRSLFQALGGFPEIPVMEDLDLIRKLSKHGTICIAKEPALTSPRRWEQGGLVRTFLRHQIMLAAHSLHLPASWIAKMRH
ncbi:MAG: TIGR04283 family arsenosugar biosynthesis glycosyltransferase [Akkermansiaceae bacterium]|nr:TIGR04283 family arsenosugar biosynthesis glycosyltransferase [Akkermansiaceae bacterium]